MTRHLARMRYTCRDIRRSDVSQAISRRHTYNKGRQVK